ncbi:hypothetical protein TcYC6_0020600 [Trypanosoma cruzi]|nr:hypothetical protein TcYC6_0020600 [Trypanosoma cruzi]
MQAGAVPNSRRDYSKRRGITTVDEAESPVARRGSAALGVCDEAVAEGPGPPRMPAFVLPAFLACWLAWIFRWQPAREAPAKKTVEPLQHPHGRPVKLSERQAEHVKHVPSYCGQTSALCRRLGRRTSIRRSLVGKKLRRSRREESPAEAVAGRSPQ